MVNAGLVEERITVRAMMPGRSGWVDLCAVVSGFYSDDRVRRVIYAHTPDWIDPEDGLPWEEPRLNWGETEIRLTDRGAAVRDEDPAPEDLRLKLGAPTVRVERIEWCPEVDGQAPKVDSPTIDAPADDGRFEEDERADEPGVPAGKTRGRRPKRTDADKTHDEYKIVAHLVGHPDATRDEVATAAHVSQSKAWKAHSGKRKDARNAEKASKLGIGGVGDPTTDLGAMPDDANDDE